jgi:hypothetical protein
LRLVGQMAFRLRSSPSLFPKLNSSLCAQVPSTKSISFSVQRPQSINHLKKKTHSVYTRIEKKKYCFLSVNAQKRRWEIKISVLMLSRWFFVCTGTQYVSRSVHPCHQRATLISNSCAAAGEIWSINRRRHTTGLRRCCCLLAISVYLMGERTVRQGKAVMILLLSTFLRCGEKAWKLTLPSKRLLLLKVILSSLNQNWANFPDSNVSVLHASSNEGRITK